MGYCHWHDQTWGKRANGVSSSPFFLNFFCQISLRFSCDWGHYFAHRILCLKIYLFFLRWRFNLEDEGSLLCFSDKKICFILVNTVGEIILKTLLYLSIYFYFILFYFIFYVIVLLSVFSTRFGWLGINEAVYAETIQAWKCHLFLIKARSHRNASPSCVCVENIYRGREGTVFISAAGLLTMGIAVLIWDRSQTLLFCWTEGFSQVIP